MAKYDVCMTVAEGNLMGRQTSEAWKEYVQVEMADPTPLHARSECQKIIDEFNRTLRKGEARRILVDVAIKGEVVGGTVLPLCGEGGDEREDWSDYDDSIEDELYYDDITDDELHLASYDDLLDPDDIEDDCGTDDDPIYED